MSRFDSLMGEIGVPVLFENNGRSVTYTHPDSDDVTLTAIVTPEQAGELPDLHGGLKVRRVRWVTISTDPTAPEGGVASPRQDAAFTIGGESWKVQAIEMLSGSLARLRVVFIGMSEVTRPRYRVQ